MADINDRLDRLHRREEFDRNGLPLRPEPLAQVVARPAGVDDRLGEVLDAVASVVGRHPGLSVMVAVADGRAGRPVIRVTERDGTVETGVVVAGPGRGAPAVAPAPAQQAEVAPVVLTPAAAPTWNGEPEARGLPDAPFRAPGDQAAPERRAAAWADRPGAAAWTNRTRPTPTAPWDTNQTEPHLRTTELPSGQTDPRDQATEPPAGETAPRTWAADPRDQETEPLNRGTDSRTWAADPRDQGTVSRAAQAEPRTWNGDPRGQGDEAPEGRTAPRPWNADPRNQETGSRAGRTGARTWDGDPRGQHTESPSRGVELRTGRTGARTWDGDPRGEEAEPSSRGTGRRIWDADPRGRETEPQGRGTEARTWDADPRGEGAGGREPLPMRVPVREGEPWSEGEVGQESWRAPEVRWEPGQGDEPGRHSAGPRGGGSWHDALWSADAQARFKRPEADDPAGPPAEDPPGPPGGTIPLAEDTSAVVTRLAQLLRDNPSLASSWSREAPE